MNMKAKIAAEDTVEDEEVVQSIPPEEDAPPDDDIPPEDDDADEAEPKAEADEDEEDDANPTAASPQPGVGLVGVTINDFYAYMPRHSYIFAPTGEFWSGSSINVRVPKVPMKKKNGDPVLGENGKPKRHKPTVWLDKRRPVEQMTWAPGMGAVIKDYLIAEGGWFYRKNCSVFNLYKPPIVIPVRTEKPTMGLDHIRKIYPNDYRHLIYWLAHRVQHPEVKCNHAIVLGGNQGIGKDTLLEPVKRAVGAWNFKETTPAKIMGRFNPHLKSVILRISEARDLGDFDRFSFYDHTKNFIAAPPDVLEVDEKNLREHYILNVVGIIITTNHKSDGIYLPSDDRRHYVAWSSFDKSHFDKEYWNRFWKWYDSGGIDIVASYLMNLDLTGFDPKAPPPQTPAFWDIVNASRTPEDAELSDALDELAKQALVKAGVGTKDIDARVKAAKLHWPDAVTIHEVDRASTSQDFIDYLRDRRNSRRIPHRFESCGYVPVRNPDANDGLWRLNNRRQVIYAKSSLDEQQRLAAAKKVK